MGWKQFLGGVLQHVLLARIYGSVRNGFISYQHKQIREQYDIHPEFNLTGTDLRFYGEGEISAGPNSYNGQAMRVYAAPGTKVDIGENCGISHYVAIYTGNRVADQDMSRPDRKYSQGDVRIEDHAWIGANVFITEGVTIGENAVVGANSVVTRDIPAHSIAAGTPAKIQKFKSYLDEERRDELAEENEAVLSESLRDELFPRQKPQTD